MKAIVLTEHGGPETVVVAEVAEPGPPGPGEIAVRVRAMALNHLDLWVRDGLPGIRQKLPMIMGCDAAGEITAVGDGVSELREGDRVMLTPIEFCERCEACTSGEQSLCRSFRMRGEHGDGLFAEHVVVKAHAARVISPAIAFTEAAAYGLTFLTAYRMLFSRGALEPGETVLIHGIGGGVSLAALALATRVGARVLVTSGDDWKLERARSLGAAAGVNYKQSDVAKEVFKLTERRGVDVVVDSVGGSTWPVSIKVTRPGARIVTCGATAGGNPPAELVRIFWKQLVVLGSTMGNLREWTRVAALLNEGKVAPVVDRVFPANEVRAAHEHLGSSRHFGKIVLTF